MSRWIVSISINQKPLFNIKKAYSSILRAAWLAFKQMAKAFFRNSVAFMLLEPPLPFPSGRCENLSPKQYNWTEFVFAALQLTLVETQNAGRLSQNLPLPSNLT